MLKYYQERERLHAGSVNFPKQYLSNNQKNGKVEAAVVLIEIALKLAFFIISSETC